MRFSLLFWLMLLTGCSLNPTHRNNSNTRATVTGSAVEQACQARQVFFESNAQQYRSSTPLFEKFFLGNADIILIGDEHATHETETVGGIIDEMEASASRPDCLLIEKDKASKYAVALQDFFKGDDAAFKGFDDPSFFMRWNGDMASFIAKMTKLRNAGIKAISVDDDTLQSSSTVLANLNDRDKGMADTINKLFSDKTCHKALYSVGAMHILKSNAGTGRKTLYHHLNEAGHKISSVILIVAGKMSTYSSTGPSQFPNRNSTMSNFGHWSPEYFIPAGQFDSLACKSTLDILDHPYAFENRKLTDAPLLYSPKLHRGPYPGFPGLPTDDGTDFFGRYSDFDAVWVHPCQEAECKQQNQTTRKALVERGFHLYQPLPFQEHELDWPITFLNKENSIGDQLETYIGNDGNGYIHGGCDLVTEIGADVFAPIDGKIEAGYYDLKYLPDGSYEKTVYPLGFTIPNSVKNALRFEIALIHESGYRFEFHHIDPKTLPSAVTAAIAAKASISKGTVIGKVIQWPASGQEFSWDFRMNLATSGKQVNVNDLYRKSIKLTDGTTVKTINDNYWTRRFLIRLPVPTGASGSFAIFAEDQNGNRAAKNGTMP